MTRVAVGAVVMLGLLAGCAAPAPVLARKIALPGVGAPRKDVGVPGRLDHFAYDATTQRLFVAALENNTLEVLDLEKGARIKSIGGLEHPQGIAVATSVGCAVVACGGGNICVYDVRTLEAKKVIALGRGADNVRYDAPADTIYVTYGSTSGGAIAAFNPHTWEKVREIPFKSRPESFQLDLKGTRLFANLPEGVRATKDGVLAVVNRQTGDVQKEILLKDRARNFPMSFDAEHERLFIACRRPARLIEIDTRKNEIAAEIECTDDSDDLFYDSKTGRVIVIGGGFRPDLQEPPPGATLPVDETGALDVFSVGANGELKLVAQTRTAPHVRVGLFVPARRMIYVAVPPREGRDAEIWEYRVAD